MQRYVHLVDLVKRFPTTIYLQKQNDLACLLACVDTAEKELILVNFSTTQGFTFHICTPAASRPARCSSPELRLRIQLPQPIYLPDTMTFLFEEKLSAYP